MEKEKIKLRYFDLIRSKKFKILYVLNSSHGVWVIPFLEFLFMYNSVLENNFYFASLLMNLLVLVYLYMVEYAK